MPFLIRRFGLTDYGIYLLAGSLSVYLGLLDFGVGTTVMKFVAEYRARAEDHRLGALVSNVLFYYTCVGVFISAFLFLFSIYGIGLFHLPPESVPLARNLFMAGAAISLFAWPLMVGGAVLNGLQRYDLTARVGSAVVIGNIAATAIVLAIGQGPLVLLAATGAVGICGGVAYGFLALRQIPGAPISFGLVSRGELKLIFSFSWVVFVMQVASVIVYQQTDRMVLGIFVGAAAVGLYEAASKIHGLVSQLSGMPVAALLPAASQLDAEDRADVLRALFVRGNKYTNAFVLPIATGLIVLARPLIRTWLGPVLALQAPNAQLFVSYWVVWVNLAVPLSVFLGMGKLRFLLWFTIAQSMLNLALSITLVRFLGVRGVILGTVISNLVLFPFGFAYALRTFDVGFTEWARRVAAPTYPLLALPVALGFGAQYLGLTSSLFGVGVVGVVCVGAYWLAVFAVGFSPSERADVLAVSGLVRRRLGLGGEE